VRPIAVHDHLAKLVQARRGGFLAEDVDTPPCREPDQRQVSLWTGGDLHEGRLLAVEHGLDVGIPGTVRYPSSRLRPGGIEVADGDEPSERLARPGSQVVPRDESAADQTASHRSLP